MPKRTKTILLILLITAIVAGVYQLFFKDMLTDNTAVLNVVDSPRTSSFINQEALLLFECLENATFNSEVLNTPTYLCLIDRSVAIRSVPLGRNNPFADVFFGETYNGEVVTTIPSDEETNEAADQEDEMSGDIFNEINGL